MVIHLFTDRADPQMARIAMAMLEKENPTIQKQEVKVNETENSVWYSSGKNYGKVATFQNEKYCKP